MRVAWFSYHGGHSGQFCRHAKGSLREVVERAIQRGFTHYGLSEHCPRLRSIDLFHDESDLEPSQLEAIFDDYVREARALQLEFAGSIELLVGFETEALPPDDWRRLMKALRERHGFDYIVGSVHSVGSVPIDYLPERAAQAEQLEGGWDALCLAYFAQVTELVRELRPEVTGHLDLIRRFKGDQIEFSKQVWESIEAALHAVKDAGSLLEVNGAPVRRGFGPVYPLPRILLRARELGVRVTLGDDSHGPHDVGEGLDACVAALAQAGYREVHLLDRAEGRVVARAVPLTEVQPTGAS